MKLSQKSNQGFICDWIWVKHLCKRIITTKEALFRFNVVLFSGKLIFNVSCISQLLLIKTAIFKTLRMLDTTWNFAYGLYTWTRTLRTLFVYTEFTKKKVFGQLTLAVASPACHRHGRQKVSIPECDLTGRRAMVDRSSSLPVRLYNWTKLW